MPEKNKNYEITITGFGSNGEGIGRIDNMAVFVPGGCEGDVLEIKLMKVKSSYAVGKILRILKPSEFRQTSFCPASSRCGGCQLAHVVYDKQLTIKKQMVTDCLERIGGLNLHQAEVFDTLGMESPYRYRNKMVFPIGRDSSGKPVGGFYAQRSHTVVPLEDCMLGSSAASVILHTVLDFMNEYRISVMTKQGIRAWSAAYSSVSGILPARQWRSFPLTEINCRMLNSLSADFWSFLCRIIV